MPPKYCSRRRFNKVLRGRTTKRTTARVARTALRMVKQLKRAEEVKRTTIVNASELTQINDDGIISPLTAISVGSTFAQRIGNEVLLKKLSIEGAVQRGGADTSVATIVKLCLILDRQQVPGSTPPLVSDIFSSGQLGTVNAPYARMNVTQVGRFQILKSFRVILTPDNPSRQFKLIYKSKSHKLRFTGTSDTAFRNGTVWLFACSNKDVVAPTALPLYQMVGSMTFTDD